MINKHINATALITCLLLAGVPACQPVDETPADIQQVVPRDQLQHFEGAVSLGKALESATPGTEIALQQGTYLVDNPVVLHTGNLLIRGASRDNTRIVPQNHGQPVFMLASDRITLESITIDALLTDRSGRASHAIEIVNGHGDCLITHVKILNTGAAAVLGESASGCTLIDNVILNSGTDAVQLRGDRLTAVGNTIVRYFDEALDLASGSDIIVTRNRISQGRIGIVVDDSNNALIASNIVDKQLQEGIVTGADREAVVTGNIVIDAGYKAYQLHSPRVVTGNTAQGNHETGFQITRTDDTIFSGNSAIGSQQGFDFIPSGEAIAGNRPAAAEDNITVETAPDPLQFDNCSQRLTYGTISGCNPDFPSSLNVQTEKNQLHDYLNSPEIIHFTSPADIQGITSIDTDTARRIAGLFRYYNPGFLSIQVNGTVMRSDITEDLYNRLLGVGQKGVGLVRAPFLRFSGGQRSFYWYLSHADKDVIMVSSMHGGARVKFTKLQDGKPGYMDSVILLVDKFLLKYL